MAETMWRYLDPAGNEHGPYSTEELRKYLGEGRIDRAGQVWREGMTAWASIDSIASELGLVRPGGPRVVVRAPKDGKSGCGVAAIVIVVCVLIIGGVFAAIAVSSYEDYGTRARVSEGAMLAEGVKVPVSEFYNNNGQQWPDNNEAVGLAAPEEIRGTYVSSVQVADGGQIFVSFSAQPGLDGAILVYTPTAVGDGNVQWQCSSDTIAQKYCPSSCVCSK